MNNITVNAVLAGASRGWEEYRQSFSNSQDLFNYFGTSGVFLVVAFLLQDSTVEGAEVSVGAMIIASAIGFLVAMGGIITVAQILATEREDGTLLRAKALPKGMVGYFVGKAVHVLLVTATNTAIVLFPPFLLIDGFAFGTQGDWFTFAWVLLLGITATVPIGAVLGSLIKSPRSTMGLLMIPVMGLTMISGIFFQFSAVHEWAQWIAQVFPLYWVGLGMRSVFLPDAMLAVEIGESWRHLETAGVLGLWTVVGLVVAPILLRRAAQRESGSRMAEAREKAMQSTV
ncbi:ABC transporter permease [Marinactinospora thermotolerans]|uniref:ABC-2 type transport system permease protein n=1 Tax=Marinactinospora thermotolerans DSM 45154 TaxID=1122192 RepID=A0A1T4N9D2_9ACTN|nr:ABC transporter permease [Marinactinospora thermotolerans]SJZ75755.1 ABC-2 type transport system permease protein [Marinactinospora thermotolerans DSM 45154]